MNPSDDHLGGFETIAHGIFVPGGYFNSKGVFTNNAINVNQLQYPEGPDDLVGRREICR